MLLSASPVAHDDLIETTAEQAVQFDPVANDFDADGDQLTLIGVSEVDGGTAAINGNSVTWAPHPGFLGQDTLHYTISDGHGNESVGSIVVTVNAPGAAQVLRPFGQHVNYATGSILPDHVLQSKLDDDVRALYDDWKQRFLLPAGVSAGQPMYRVALAEGSSETVSEGQGYGMVVVAYMAGHDPAAQELFDGMWAFAQANPSTIDGRLMDWHTPDVHDGNDSAFDGDADIAYALLLANAQWSSNGNVDYAAAAATTIAGIYESTIGPDSQLPELGDWVSAHGQPFNQNTPRPGDFMPAHFRSFAQATEDHRWNDVIAATQTVVDSLQTNHAPVTGLLPDFVVNAVNDPQPSPGTFLEGPYDNTYSYNSARVPWRIGLDGVLNGDSTSIAQALKLSHWAEAATGGNPNTFHAGYQLDGIPVPGRAYMSTAFVAPLGVAAMNDSSQQAWLNSIYDVVSTSRQNYFEDSIALISMIAMSGNYWSPTASAAPQDPPPPSEPDISIADITLNEGDSGTTTGVFTVSLNEASSVPVTIDYTTSDGTATAGSDYTPMSGTVSIDAGQTTATIAVEVLGDTEDEDNETFSINLSNAVGAMIDDGQALATIVDDDQQQTPPTTPGFQYETTSDWGSGFNGQITLSNSGSTAWSNWTVEFDWDRNITQIWNAEIVSHIGNHYVIGNLSWNGSVEAGQTVSFGFGGNPGNVTDSPVNVVINGTSVNGDPPPPSEPDISIADITLNEGDSGTTTGVFTVSLNEASSVPVTIDYTTSDGTATAGSDYTPMSGTVSIDAGQTTATIAVEVLGDTEDEDNETFSINLSNAVGAMIDDGQALATIVDDDQQQTPPPVDSIVSISDTEVTEGDSGLTTATFTVSLNEPSNHRVTLDFSTRDGSALAGLDYVSSSGFIAIEPGDITQTITIDVVGDTTDEATENFYVDLLGIAGAIAGDTTGLGTVYDDDDPDPPADPGSETRIIGYFPSWGIYGRDYQVEDIPAEKLTHINYAFANIGADLRITMGDSYADSLNFAALRTLKQQYTELQTMISVGGWTWSERFSDVALTAASREAFAESAVDFMLNHGFDGIDIDWEYPVAGGEWDNVNRPEDKQNYTLLMQELRTQLDALESQHGRDYWLSIAAPAGPSTMQNLEIANLSATLDWINLMAYDLAGHWDPQTGHNAPLYDQADNPADNRLNWNSSIDAYLTAGVPNDKLVIGAPFYGRVFGGVGSTNNGLFQPDTQIVSGTDGQAGYLSYWDIQERYLHADSGYTRYWDNEAQVPYLYNSDTQQFVTYDDEQSIGLKADFINDRNLGGLMFWELATDARDNSLLNTVYDRIGGPPGPPSLRVSDASVIEGDSGTSTLTFLVTLTRASEEPVTVDFATHDATAMAGQDYTETSGTLTFAAGETSREVSVGVLGEALEEANETLLLKLSNATGAELAQNQSAGTIIDDDTPIAVSVAFEITGDWGSGHVGNVTITNNTTETITGWRLEFDYSGEIQSVWSSILISRDGNHYVVECPSWAEDIAAGSTVSFGWNGNGPGGQLSNVTLNGLQAILS